ncbi:MAG: sodium:proton antiporter [Terrimonas ferruginea]|uniref:cation:proton antiporter n=1 Tax=Terrimonas ferruginea TaxID=249 RepID=UPI0009278A85|nr:sodium:proton antiporter [Terrimonas ferruginea]MBN8785100.1 sodium:proton antiporter [Terrimonas ferruginea]OJW42364.1 MAG: sodium:proton antiporter [Sphingobacteriales bacterium 48-107]
MELYYSFSVLIVLAAVFSYINGRFLKLPSTIGIMVIAMLASIILVVTGSFFPKTFLHFSRLLEGIDFTEVLMGAMLNFLLFAGAIHIHLSDLREQRTPIMVFSTLSVVLSTVLVGSILYFLFPLVYREVPFIYCLLFGALISPTDPVAVLGILKTTNVSRSLETKVAGESLFNDGVAVVVFTILLQVAQNSEVEITAGGISWLLLKEAVGGLAGGLLIGWLVSKAMQRIDDYKIAVLLTLAAVMGGYLFARAIHISGPLMMVAAGLVIGNYGKKTAMSDTTKDYLEKFWELLDEILNAILFLFIGFELLLIENLTDYWLVGLIGIMVVLIARFFSIWIPTKVIPFKNKFSTATVKLLVWGGLRGGVSIALALSVDPGPYKNFILAITYIVVVFSILVQGLTIGKVAKKLEM